MYNPKDKNSNNLVHLKYLFSKTVSMFEWEGLPETIPVEELERLLQWNGFAYITEVHGELYAFNGGLGGQGDVYNRPTEIVISNPALNFFKTLNIERDGVLLLSDTYRMGLQSLFSRYSYLIGENTINMHLTGLQTRMRNVLSASDDRTKESAELYLQRIEAGELAVIGESALFEGLKNHSAVQSGSSLVDLIEYNQYIKAELYSEIGLNLSFNMKRERLNEAEVGLSEDVLFPFVDNMAACRLKGVEELNEKFDLSVLVGFGSTWHNKRLDTVDGIVETNEIENETSNDSLHESDESFEGVPASEEINVEKATEKVDERGEVSNFVYEDSEDEDSPEVDETIPEGENPERDVETEEPSARVEGDDEGEGVEKEVEEESTIDGTSARIEIDEDSEDEDEDEDEDEEKLKRFRTLGDS